MNETGKNLEISHINDLMELGPVNPTRSGGGGGHNGPHYYKSLCHLKTAYLMGLMLRDFS